VRDAGIGIPLFHIDELFGISNKPLENTLFEDNRFRRSSGFAFDVVPRGLDAISGFLECKSNFSHVSINFESTTYRVEGMNDDIGPTDFKVFVSSSLQNSREDTHVQ
jgi:hypothetical protein